MVRRLMIASLLLLLTQVGLALSAVQTWQQIWAGSQAAAPTAVIARELADGSRMIVAYDLAVHAVRYDSAGNQLSASQFYPPFFSLYTFGFPNTSFASVVAVDPFGGVFVASVCDVSSLVAHIWLMKYDGLTGNALWPNPIVLDGPPSSQSSPVRLRTDSQGNVVLVGQSTPFNNTVVFKADGISGALLWGPVTISTTIPADAILDSSRDVLIGASNGIYKLSGETGAFVWGPVPFGATVKALASDQSGNVVVAGSGSNDIRLAKYSGASGALVWGPSTFSEASSPSPRATGVEVSPSGAAILVGTSGNQSVILQFSGTTGALLWGPQRIPTNGNLPPLTVRSTADGDVVASGWDDSYHLFTSRYRSADGSLVWGPQVDFSAVFDFSIGPVSIVSSNGRVLTSVLDFDGTQSSLTTLERNSDTGGVAWSSSYGASVAGRSYVTDVTQGPDGSVFVTGYTYPPRRFVTFKYARSNGAVLWGPALYSDPSGSTGFPYTVRTDSAGDVFVVGPANGATLLKYSGTTGSQLWLAKLGGMTPARLAIAASGDVFVTGQIYNGTDYDYATMKVSGATGGVIWGPAIFNRGTGRNDWPTAIGVTPGGDLIVSGTSMSNSPTTPAEWVTFKYSGSTGVVLWGPAVFSPSGGDGDSVRDLAIDASGNFYLVGKAFNGSDNDMATIKYDGSTGTVLWGPKLVAGSGNYYDEAAAVALDSNGDVFVAGSVFNDHTPPAGSYNYDFATIKYRGSDGVVLWGPRIFNGVANDHDLAEALALDSAGNPIVAGTSTNAAHNKDIAILKYDGATGATLWGPIIAGGIGEEELPLHDLVALGKSVVVSGTSSFRFFTAAYDESFGIQTLPDEIPPAYCSRQYATLLVAGNASGAVAWSIVSGSLPPGLFLDSSTGEISGTPTGEGIFAFRARAQDSAGPTAERDFVIIVPAGSAFVPILTTANPVCPGQSSTLSVSGSWSSYHWLPGGESPSSVTVSPIESTDYGVLLTDVTGCTVRGYGRVVVVSHGVPILGPPSVCSTAMGIAASTPDAGPGASYSWSISNGSITSGAGTASITFSAGSLGYVQIFLTVTDTNGCIATGSRSLPISECMKSFYTLTPCRVIDTRNPNGPLAGPALAGGASRTFRIADQCGIPADAVSVSANVTITGPTAQGHLTFNPAGLPPPPVSTINFRTGQTRANNAILLLGAAGDIVVSCAGSGTVDFILDVNGYFR